MFGYCSLIKRKKQRREKRRTHPTPPISSSSYSSFHLVIVAGGLALRVQETRPVLALEIGLQVDVDERLDVRATGTDLEHGQVTGRLELAQDKGAEDGGERAPVPDELAGLEAEGGLVEGADDGAVAEGSLVEGRAEVGADVGDAVDGAVIVGHEEELQALGLDGDDVTGGDVCGLEEGDPLVLGLHALDTDGAIRALGTGGQGASPGGGPGELRHCFGLEGEGKG